MGFLSPNEYFLYNNLYLWFEFSNLVFINNHNIKRLKKAPIIIR